LWAQRGLSPEFLQQIAQMKAGPGFSGQVTPLAEEAPEAGLRSFVNLPLVSKGKVLGSMVLATREEGLFGPMEVELLTAIGQQIGVAIDNAQLFQEAQKREKEAEALHKIGVEVSALLDLDQILRSVADKARQLLGTETATLALLDDSSQEVYIRAASGTTGQALLQVRLKPGQGMAGKVAGTGQALRTEDYLSDTSFPHDHDADAAVREEGLRAFLSVPLKIGVKVFGSLTVADRRSHAFSDHDLDLLSRLANQAAVAIENSQLYARVQDIAVLEERDRISREMHDGLCQVLGYLHLKTRTVEDLVASGQEQKALDEMRDMRKVARDAYDDARQAMAGLRAAGLPQKGLLTPLQEYLQGFRAQSGIPEVELIVKDERATRFASGAEVQLIRVLQEALTNVRRHAQASRVEVRFEVEDDQAIITVADNGVGFDPSLVTKQRPQHYGLQTMRERAESVGGSLAVDSAPGKGTREQIRLPKGGG
ncbi:MAG: GAF domain-containing protein, partial [Chloroflexota bacterium]|nr:GAF domain-containing protein [Chloroflexota bacterium]